MDVVLVQPEVRLSRSPSRRATAPLGILSVATPLDVAGYKVRIIDQRVEPDWERSLLSELKTKPICVGVTSMTGPQIWWALKASEVVKNNSDVPVVWGGVHASLLPRQTLENPNIDIVVQGEGEETFFELVRALGNKESLGDIKGIWYKESGEIKQNPSRPFIDLNQQPPLSYHLIDLQKHMMSMSGIDALQFETSRGCPFNCTFCYNTSFNIRRWRALTVEQTLSRMKRVIDEYGVKGFAFSDDNFFTDRDRAFGILEGIIQQGPGINWGKGDIRLDLLSQLDDYSLRLIEKSGCQVLVIGIESGSQRMANILRKEIDVSQVFSVNRRLAEYKIKLKYLFLIGVPGEAEEDLVETISMMLRLVAENPQAAIGVQICVPYPGTELFNLSQQYGINIPQKLEEWVPFSWANRRLSYPWLSPERKKLLQMISFSCYFMAEGNTTILSDVKPLISFVSRLYRPIARRRLKGLHYKFMPELKFAEFLGFRGY